jgi:hypothetical protein
MTQRTLVAISAALILAQLPAFARPKRKEYDNSAAQVFDAAIRTARARHVVTYVEEKRMMFTFETGRSSLSSGFIANASVEAESETKSALVINVQHKESGDGFSFNAGDRMADKFYEQVTEELAKNPTQKIAVKPEAPPVTVPPPPVPATTTAHDYGTVAVTCAIESADVTVDGSFVGNLPASLRLSPGKHTVQVSLAGYKSWSREITVMAGAELRLIATLTKE